MYASVFFDGAYEPASSTFVRAWLRKGDCVIDIGANHGWYSLLMAAAVGDEGTVIACEPMPSMVYAWRRNFARNPHLRADLAITALGGQPGVTKLHQFVGLPHGHASVTTLGRSDYESTQVTVERLDDLLRHRPRPHFIKLDVEGSELAVLKGATRLLAGPRAPSWLVEVNYETSRAMGYSPLDLYAYLSGAHAYEVYRVVDGGLVPELCVRDAPHGTSWLFVSKHDRERVRAISILAA